MYEIIFWKIYNYGVWNRLCDLLLRKENGEDVILEFMTLDEFLESYNLWFEELLLLERKRKNEK